MTAEAALARIDPYPYQHRLSEVMTSPVRTIAGTADARAAAAAMRQAKISSLLVADAAGKPVGIVTERDILNAVAQHGAPGLERPVEALMTAPVRSLPPDAFVFSALARMAQGGFRHLAVTDPLDGRLLGIVTAGALLKLRAQHALILADDGSAAHSAADLAAIQKRVPEIAGGLLNEGVPARQIAAVISAVLRDLSRRA
ncbi:MAG TPA: CBS domain-containing protein, partial [Dongiaceae bacterium]|nr:CBS domain-containing protein [Dongiaceae bacterium]